MKICEMADVIVITLRAEAALSPFLEDSAI